jgi:predicted transcriptional regulator
VEQKNWLIELTAEIVVAHVRGNLVQADDVAALVQSVHSVLSNVASTPSPEPQSYKPAVSIRSSVTHEALVCLMCGSKQKTLKRHLLAAHQLSPAEYCVRYDLRSDYPMVSLGYSKKRQALAIAAGLGRKKDGDRDEKPGRSQKASAATRETPVSQS